MYKIKVNSTYSFEVNIEKHNTLVNSLQIDLDSCRINDRHFHVLYKNKSFRAEIVEVLSAEKKCTIKINNHIYNLELKDQYDELLHRLGLDNLNTIKVSELKAPMPGLVLKVLVSTGDEVKKGDNLLVLEAMKMENIIKSPADVTIKSIKVQTSDKVEKGQVMIQFH